MPTLAMVFYLDLFKGVHVVFRLRLSPGHVRHVTEGQFIYETWLSLLDWSVSATVQHARTSSGLW